LDTGYTLSSTERRAVTGEPAFAFYGRTAQVRACCCDFPRSQAGICI